MLRRNKTKGHIIGLKPLASLTFKRSPTGPRRLGPTYLLSVEDAVAFIKGAPPSRGGPDDLEYRMLKACPKPLAEISVDAYEEVAATGVLPPHLLHSNTSDSIPKTQVQGALRGHLRPLSLNKVIGKIILLF